jgi:hypothetical protein
MQRLSCVSPIPLRGAETGSGALNRAATDCCRSLDMKTASDSLTFRQAAWHERRERRRALQSEQYGIGAAILYEHLSVDRAPLRSQADDQKPCKCRLTQRSTRTQLGGASPVPCGRLT